MIKNIKGIIFDADNTIVDHMDCERQALEYLFEKIGEKYDKAYQDIFRPHNKLEADDVIMIGDSLEKDIQGAKNANIKAIWYNPKGKNNNTNIFPDYEIKSLLELKELF